MAVDGVVIVYGGVPSVTRTVEGVGRSVVHDRMDDGGSEGALFFSRERSGRTHRSSEIRGDWRLSDAEGRCVGRDSLGT